QSLGCYGNVDVYSPVFDGFAAESRRYTTCVSTSPVCVPARGTILSGLHAWQHRAITNDLPVDASVRSLSHALREAGYSTGYVGKWHLGGVPRDRAIPADERLGFEEWKAAECTHDYADSWYHDEDEVRHEIGGFESATHTHIALDFISRHQAARASTGEPWALVLSWGPPHDPYDVVPERFRDLYAGKELELRENVSEEVALIPAGSGTIGRDEIHRRLADYYAQISYLDEQFERLLGELDRLGAADDTIVVYTSDHGDMLGSQGKLMKQLPYDESILMPLIVRWPGHIEPGLESQPVGLVDLAPALCSLAGAALGDGRAPATHDGAQLIYNMVPCHQAIDRGETRGWYGLRTERFTYALWDDGQPFCFFDNESDPLQLLNLFAHRSEGSERRAARLHARLEEMLATAGWSVRRWDEVIVGEGYLEAWNESQRWFGRTELG
ncbi:MAG: sulfatase-like hydrolase/transferase, partial [Spirochaetota bacterium]